MVCFISEAHHTTLSIVFLNDSMHLTSLGWHTIKVLHLSSSDHLAALLWTHAVKHVIVVIGVSFNHIAPSWLHVIKFIIADFDHVASGRLHISWHVVSISLYHIASIRSSIIKVTLTQFVDNRAVFGTIRDKCSFCLNPFVSTSVFKMLLKSTFLIVGTLWHLVTLKSKVIFIHEILLIIFGFSWIQLFNISFWVAIFLLHLRFFRDDLLFYNIWNSEIWISYIHSSLIFENWFSVFKCARFMLIFHCIWNWICFSDSIFSLFFLVI